MATRPRGVRPPSMLSDPLRPEMCSDRYTILALVAPCAGSVITVKAGQLVYGITGPTMPPINAWLTSFKCEHAYSFPAGASRIAVSTPRQGPVPPAPLLHVICLVVPIHLDCTEPK